MSDQYGYQQPYPAPAAPPMAPVERPKTLTYAVIGMWIGALLDVVSTIVLLTTDMAEMKKLIVTEMEKQPTYDPSVFEAENMADVIVSIVQIGGVVFGVISLGLWIWMAIMNGKGRNWARITATVFGSLSLISSLSSLGNLAGSSTFGDVSVPTSAGSVVVTVAQLLLVIAILVLLWMSPTNAYVNAVTAQRKASRQGYPAR
ncbi:hypothetical protein FB381_0579 [Nocardioides albertanoniae]|uniref:Uncharacterized protein n=1 Tax=Nocardioides albertanoniae TaxID=1175486 RepID=A0A543A299_9ACTN|nr:hypothetical protein [Nocardioides albertanoniae]TQL66714.1 hypothetical protein FB381_0579 [Nocardioides albertanoniae]